MRPSVRVAAILVLAACSKGENRPGDSSALNLAQISATQRVPGPGELTKPLANYTGEEFYALTESLQYAGANERARRCRGNGCTGVNAETTRLLVEGVVGENAVPLDSVPQFGVIVSRGRNLGGLPDLMYGMRPGNRYSYFVVMLPGAAGGAARYQIEQLDVAGNNRSHSPLVSGTIRGCGHPPAGIAGADFRICADTSTVRPASFRRFQPIGEAPWWFHCDQGCCELEGPQQG